MLNIYVIQIIKALQFIVLVPIINTVFDPKTSSDFIIAIALGSWMSIIVDFGLNYTALYGLSPKDGRLGSVLTGVWSARLLISVILIILLPVIQAIFLPNISIFVLLAGCIYYILQSLSPLWILMFYGYDQIYTSVELIFRLSAFLSALFLIKININPSISVFTVGSFFGVITLLSFIFRFKKIETFGSLNIQSGVKLIVKGSKFFPTLFFSSFSTMLGVVIFATARPDLNHNLFGVPEKIIRSGMSMLEPINRFFYSKIISSNLENAGSVGNHVTANYRGFAYFFAIILLSYLLGFLATPIVIKFALNDSIVSGTVYRILINLIVLIGINTILSLFILLPMNKGGIVSIFNGISSIIFIFCAYFMSKSHGYYGMSYAALMGEVAMLAFMTSYILIKAKVYKGEDRAS